MREARRIGSLRTATIQANFRWTYVRLYAERPADLYGTGECFFAPGLEGILQEFEEILRGEDFTATEYLVERMRWAATGAGSLGGLVWNAITGIEAALLDLKGKYFGVPVYQLLGGKVRDSVRIYLDCHAGEALESLDALLQPVTPSWQEAAGPAGGADAAGSDAGSGGGAGRHAGDRAGPAGPGAAEPPGGGTGSGGSEPTAGATESRDAVVAAAAERAKRAAESGYDLLKFDLDLPGSTFDSATGYELRADDRDWLIHFARQLRETVGPDVDLAFDAHWRYRPAEIVDVARGLEDVRPIWLEDPVPPHDVEGTRYVREHTAVPIATGENLQLRHGFAPFIERDSCDILTPDLQKAGGLVEGKYIAAHAALRNKPIAVHMIGSPIALAASVHAASTMPNFIACEFHASDVPFFSELCTGGTEEWFSPGRARPPEGPGLGIELDETTLERYLLHGSKPFRR